MTADIYRHVRRRELHDAARRRVRIAIIVLSLLGLDLPPALEAHKEAQLIAANTEDAQEGPRAWVEKREPIFKGR